MVQVIHTPRPLTSVYLEGTTSVVSTSIYIHEFLLPVRSSKGNLPVQTVPTSFIQRRTPPSTLKRLPVQPSTTTSNYTHGLIVPV
jgi:hypothetical protein